MTTKKRAAGRNDANIPTLTDVVTQSPPPDAELTARVLKLAEELAHNAAREIEAIILERICDQLRERLPALIDETLKAPHKKTLKSGHG